jgi:hypothetical protein
MDGGARRGRGALWAGVALIVAGLVAAVALIVVSSSRRTDTVEKLARAVAGQQTTLEFEKAGLYTLYYEYAGEFPATVEGQTTTVVLSAPETPPDFSLQLLDANDADIPLRRAPDVSYEDVAGFSGVAFRQVRVREPGVYRLRIAPTGDELPTFAIAIGKDVPDAFGPLAFTGLGLGLAGVLLGAVLIAVGGRRRSEELPQPGVGDTAWAPGAGDGWRPPTGPLGTLPGPPSTGPAPGAPLGTLPPPDREVPPAAAPPSAVPAGWPAGGETSAAGPWGPPAAVGAPSEQTTSTALDAALAPVPDDASGADGHDPWAPPVATAGEPGAATAGPADVDEEPAREPRSGAPLPPPSWPPPSA